MRRIIIAILSAMLTTLAASADEGMWLVKGIDARLAKQMRKTGLRLSPEQIYSEQQPALCSAVVAVNGGSGSGSIISDEGLMITNHHVAYSAICDLSRPGRDILTDGYWAASREEEIPLEGFTVSFLRKIVDVTLEADTVRQRLVAEGKWNSMGARKLAKILEARYAKDSELTVSFEQMWNGRQSYIYYYEVFRDVRLVATPPERLGAFGGDTDNWGWPQHKADFTVCRVYTDKDGKPADYSLENIPLKPSRRLHVADKPLKEGDFTMVVGYPGRTQRYMSSFAVTEKQTVRNPIVIDARHKKMDIMREGMDRNDTVRMKYSDRYFGLSNYADYAKWENICLRRFDVSGVRAEEERAMQAWIDADSARKANYGDLLERLERGYTARADAMRVRTDYSERWFAVCEATIMAGRLSSFVARLKKEGEYMFDLNNKLLNGFERHIVRLGEADPAVDRKLFIETVGSFFDVLPAEHIKPDMKERIAAHNGDVRAALAEIFDSSCCRSAEAMRAFLAEPKRIKAVMTDPLVELYSSMPFPQFQRRVLLAEKKAKASVTADERTYATLLYDYRDAMGKAQYPNANSTMRLSYGKVRSIVPRDGVFYDWKSTTSGYLEKVDTSSREFRPDEKMVALAKADTGVRMNFLTDNDITGGNSGSPVVNARGELVGLAFDGNRESMAGDIYFNLDYARTVCVDINYVMWILDNYAPKAIANEIRK